jgi:hypothetical protein
MRNQRKRTAAADTAISERENLKTETVVPGISRNLPDHAEPKEEHSTKKVFSAKDLLGLSCKNSTTLRN